MKLKHLFLLGGAMFMASCSDQADEGLQSLQEALKIQIDGALNNASNSRVNDGGFCTGDRIGLYGVNYTDKNTVAGTLLDAGNQVDNIRYTFDETTGWTSTASAYYKDLNTNIDLYAYYPYGTPLSTSAYEFKVEKDQQNNNGYAASDFLWAKAAGVVPSENRVKLHFTHRLSCANVILEEGTGFEEGKFEELEKSVLAMNTTHTAHINLATGEATATGAVSSEGILMMKGEDSFRAIVIPQTVSAGQPLFAITVDGVTYHFTKNEDFVYEAGKQSKFTITVDYKAMESEYTFTLTDTEIVEWKSDIETYEGEARQYYVVKQETPGTLGALIKADGKNPDKIKNLKISGNVNAVDFFFMRDSMEILQAVNMKECSIEAATEVVYYINNEKRYEYLDGIVTDSRTAKQLLEEKYPNATSILVSYISVINADEIPNEAFSGKKSLVYYSFPEVVVRIGSVAFSGTLLSGALIIPDDVIEIGHNAFRETNISSVSFPNKLRSIGNHCFYECISLTGELKLPESLEEISSSCFYGCSFSGSLSIPSKLEKIPDWCFYGCYYFTGDLIVPENIKEVGSRAFAGCSGFDGQLILPEGLKSLGDGAFNSCHFQGELIIPDQIKEIESGAFSYCNFSRIVFPEELIKIGDYAFFNNRGLCGDLILPESLLTIGASAFSSCSSLASLTLPKDLNTIQEAAFSGCRSLGSITSNAVLPPTIIGDAFTGVCKDAFVVGVPSESIVKYQTASGWNEFLYEAYYDFNISHPLIRTLNASYSETSTLVAPANYAWSIKSQPEWVTISPASGVGSTEVTVTVNELEAGGANRAEQVVFQLDNKDYTSELSIEQYNYVNEGNAPVKDGDVIVEQEGTSTGGKCPTLVFIGDCFDALDIQSGKYLEKIREAIKHFFDVEPYRTYKSYFNIYIVIAVSPDSGLGTEHHKKHSKFGSKHTQKDGIVLDTDLVFEYACKPEKVTKDNLDETLVVVIENNSEYGGATYMWDDGSAISVCPVSDGEYSYDFRGTIQHEAGGHGFGKLGDECVHTQGFVGDCTCKNVHEDEFQHAKKNGWYPNLSLSGDMKEVPWSHLMFHEDYKKEVNMYEGGYYHTNGVYRSEAISCMDNHIPYYSAVSREAIVKRIMHCAGEEFSQEEFYEKDVKGATQNRSMSYWTSGSDNSYRQRAPRFVGSKPQLK